MKGFIKYIGISANGLNFAKVVGTDGKDYYFDSRSLDSLRMSDFQVSDVVSFDHVNGNRLLNIQKIAHYAEEKHKQEKSFYLLDNIKKWSIEASNEDENFFYSTDEMRKILEGDILYVIGRKGTGKTAIVNNILKTNNTINHSIKLSFKNFPFNLLYECVDEDYVQPNQYISIWQLIIYRKLSTLIINSNAVEKTIKTKLQKYLEYSDEKTSKLLKRIDEFSMGVSVLGNGFNLGISKSKTNVSWTAQLEWFKELYKNIVLPSRYYILFDELDEDYKEFLDEREKKSYISMLTSLFKATKYIKQNCSSNIIPIVFLRTDIYDQLTDSDKNKWSEYILSIEWNLDKIKDMLAYRIAMTDGNQDVLHDINFDNEFNKIFKPNTISSGNEKRNTLSIFSYIARSTQWRPRDFIKYIKICAEESCDRELDHVPNEIVKSADAKFSDYLKQEIVDEIFPVLPEISKILPIFSTIRKQSFNPVLFVEEYNKEFEKGNLKGVTAESALSLLFNYNVIGNIPSMKGQMLFKYAFKDARFNLKETIIIHRGLYKALQIF